MRKENGVLHFKENWFLKYVWGANFWKLLDDRERREGPVYPKNLCSLFWGSVGGIMVTMILLLFAGIIVAMPCFIRACGGFFGFYTMASCDSNDVFGEYKYWRKKRIPIAPWEVCAVILAVYLVYLLVKNYLWFWDIIAVAVGAVVSWTVLACLLFVVLAVLVYLFFAKTTAGKVSVEYIKAVYREMCPFVVIERDKKESE